jgi:hypothetical protein
VAYDRPSLRAARQLTPFAYPPTMKKIGMTCTIHVTVTTSIDAARRKST